MGTPHPDHPAASRIDVPGTANFREIGGHPVDGGRLPTGRLYRADSLSDLGEEGRGALRRLGMRTIVDLREPVEVEQHPDNVAGLELRRHARPVIGGHVHAQGIADLELLYRAILAERGAVLADVVRILADPDGAPAVVHCSAGKDRTGLVTALVLSVLGVDDETIAADYAATMLFLDDATLGRIEQRAIAAGLDEQIVAVALDAPKAAMLGLLTHLREEHGGAEAYLERHGLTAAELGALRAHMAPVPV